MGILIALPFLALWIGALFAALGLLFAPIAAICCRRSARQNGLNPRRYALMGGVYSCLFFVPAVLLLKEIRGREVSRNAIKRTYIVLYSYWGIGPVGLPLMLDLGHRLGLCANRLDSIGVLCPVERREPLHDIGVWRVVFALVFRPIDLLCAESYRRRVGPNLVLFAYVFLYFIWMFEIVGVLMVFTIVSETRSGVLIPLMLFMLVTTSVSVWPLLKSANRGGLGCRIPIGHLCPFIIAYLNLLLAFLSPSRPPLLPECCESGMVAAFRFPYTQAST